MEQITTRLDKDVIQMARALLLFVTYYPDYPPLQSFTNNSFKDRKDFIVSVEDTYIFADIENCSAQRTKQDVGFRKFSTKDYTGL